MTVDLQPDAAVEAAARYIAARRDAGQPVIPDIMRRFGLTAAETCEACRLAAQMRRAAG